MSRSSHLLVSVFFCLLFIAALLPRITSSQSTRRSVSLNGTTASVDVPYSGSLNITGPLTVEAWIKVNAIDGNYHDIISRIDRNNPSGGGGYSITVTNLGKLRMDLFQTYNVYASLIGTTTISTAAWHHVAGVFNGTQMRVYLDGVLDGSMNTTNAPASGTGVLRIGMAGHTANTAPRYLPSFAFGGLIDEARVSAAALYTSNFTPGLGPGSNVRGLWRFDNQTANDSSGYGNHGALLNGAIYSTDVPTTTNSAPSISLAHPLNNTTISAGSNIVMDATASDSDGYVSKVEFYQGTTLLGTDTTAPYTFTWSNVAAGSYSLTAKATDDGSSTTTSSAIALNVVASGGSNSISLNGTGASVDVPYNSTLNITGALTIEAWIKVNAIDGNYHDIISRMDRNNPSGGGGYSITVTNLGKLRLDLFQAYNVYASLIGTTTITAAAWHHVAGVFDGSQMRVYLDGVLDGSMNTTNAPASGTGVLRIGMAGHTPNAPPRYLPSYAFAGLIDEARVSAAALYTSSFTPGLGPGTNVRGLWKFDGQTANDFSGNNNHGSLQNGATYSTDVPATGGGGPQRPVAVPGGPYTSQFGQSTQFSSTGSFDPDGTIASYYWNFGDSTSATTVSPSHTYAAPGLYTATLTVTDNSGSRSSATAVVTINGTSNSRLDPLNQTGGSGENPLSRNFNFTLPLLALPGRAGMDLSLGLSYNSLVWTKTGNYISFDNDYGFPAPGFRLGFPVIQPLYFNSEVGKYAFLLIGTDGSRTELRQVAAGSVLYEAADSSHLLLDASTMILRTTDGTQLKYDLKASEYDCTEVKDRDGNYITINYSSFGRLDTVIDTLGRSINFSYDANGRLYSITQTWSGLAHYWAIFSYADTTIQTNFTGLTVTGPGNGSILKTLSRVTLADGSHYDFSYTNWGQVWKISSAAADDHVLNYRSYNLPGSPLLATSAQTDCPRFTERHDWAENWNQNTSGVEQEAITTYTAPVSDAWTMPAGWPFASPSGKRAEVTTPDGTKNKIYFIDTIGTASAWQRGLASLVITYDSGGTWRRKSMTVWTQDNTSVTFPLNPRIAETDVYDPEGHRARVEFTYQQFTFANGTSCNLPRDVYEYDADATTKLRSTRTDYNTAAAYTDRRILGLVSEKRVYEGDVNNGGALASKVGLFYDNDNGASSIQGNDAPVQHDNTNYSASFVAGRANVSTIKRYDVTNISQFTTTTAKYNTAGAAVSTTDAVGNTSQVSYIDSFSDGLTRNALAYPTKVTDPDGYFSTSKYNFDFGAMTYRQTPPPNYNGDPTHEQQPTGPEQVATYDSIGRLQRVTNQVNSAYTRYVYSTSMTRVDTYATIQEGLGEAHSFQITDGAGRVIGTASDLPGSNGGFSGQRIIYDAMGRTVKTSNPTETTASGAPSTWVTAGDDASAGWLYTEQSYDWKGRPLVTKNQDATTRTVSYTGCGCAGSQVTTLTDEGTLIGGVLQRRQQNIHADVLGRTIKTEILDWEGTGPNGVGRRIDSTTVNTYNALDQVKLTRQYAGSDTSGTYQDTTMTYDGYGRLQVQHVPEQDQNTATVYTYNADDTVNTITDARGAVATYGYLGNHRHLVTSITNSLMGNPTISASFTYDAAGNRLSMIDGAGSVAYVYSQLAQLTSETRSFTGVGSFTLNYGYNLSGELSGITDPFGAQVGYSHDKVGRLSAITGANFASVSSYASNLQYRAWGALKSMTYGNSKTLTLSYDANLRTSTYEIPTLMKKSYSYYADGRLKFTQDQLTTNSKFDRLYNYDFMGRNITALTGQEARGGAATDDRPYNEIMAYDPMGHLKLREIHQWDRDDTTGIETYTNNRRDGWHYDADGRLLDGTSNYTYDAAGQVSSFGDSDPYKTDQQLDGDGRRIKSVVRSLDPNTNQWSIEKTTYYIHSSVLGEVINEISEFGVKERGFVHAGGSVMAIQNAAGTANVTWENYDASGASYRSTDAQGAGANSAEMDPMGADAGLIKPFSWPPPKSSGELEPYYGVPELNSTSQGCELDRVPIPCDIRDSLMNNDGLQRKYWLPTEEHPNPKLQPPGKSTPGRWNLPAQVVLEPFIGDIASHGVGVFSTVVPTLSVDNEGGRLWKYGEESFAHVQTSKYPQETEKPLNAQQKEVVKDVFGTAVNFLQRFKDCANYVAANLVKQGKDPATELNKLQNTLTYFNGRDFADDERDAVAGTNGRMFHRGSGPLHIVLGYLFFDRTATEARARNEGLTPKLDLVLTILHEFKHFTEHRGHIPNASWDTSDEWDKNIQRLCIK